MQVFLNCRVDTYDKAFWKIISRMCTLKHFLYNIFIVVSHRVQWILDGPEKLHTISYIQISLLLFVILCLSSVKHWLNLRFQGSKMNGDNKPFDVEKVKILKDEKFKNGSKIIPDMNDPDPIIHEIPVFLAKELAQKLFLLQVSQIEPHILFKS